MRRNSHKKNVIFIFVLIGVISVMTISYAALSSTLSISHGDVTQSSLTFDVSFDTNTVNGTLVGSNSSSCGSVTPTANSVTGANPQLYFGDACVYKLKILNRGTSKAKVSEVTNVEPTSVTGLSSYSCSGSAGNFSCTSPSGGYVTYQLCSDQSCNTILSNTLTIASNSSKYVYFKIKRHGNNADNIVPTYTYTGGGFTITFNIY